MALDFKVKKEIRDMVVFAEHKDRNRPPTVPDEDRTGELPEPSDISEA